jgi:methionine sulfoxide reductase heme-binding subunit
MAWLKAHGIELLVHVAVLGISAWLLWDYTRGNLGANPIEQVEIRSGKYTLNILVLTLACSPAYNLSGFKPLLSQRRLLGFYSFVFAGLHLMAFAGLDYRFDFNTLWADIGSKRFVLIGLAAFLILMALALTSSEGWKKRLGKNWKRLHRLFYAAMLLATLHFIWQTKVDYRLPLIYTGVVIFLLVLRLPWVRRTLSHLPPSH